MISRDYLSVKVWDLHMETKPIETYPVRIVDVTPLRILMVGNIPESIQMESQAAMPDFEIDNHIEEI